MPEHREPSADAPLVDRVRAHLAAGRLDLPAVAAGHTAERWRALAEVARADVSEARIVEAHVDAVQILHEAGRRPAEGAVYAVWASEHPRWTVTAEGTDDTWWLTGTKAFCTGAGLVDRALVSVATAPANGDGPPPRLLVELDLGGLGAGRIDRSQWATPALADTSTAAVDLTGLSMTASSVVGAPDWYVERPGFWDGAIGPAACWAGAALGLVDAAWDHPPSGPHGRAHLGALSALAWHLRSTLDAAGREVDVHRDHDRPGAARATALTVRHLVDVACAEVQDRFARALGPRALTSEPAVVARDQALSLYRRQCHAERDLEALGDLLHSLHGSPTSDQGARRPASET